MEELKKWMSKNKVKYVVLMNGEKPNPNVIYFSGYTGYGCLIIPDKDEPFLYVPDMEIERAKKLGKFKVIQAKKKLFEFLGKGKIGLDFENTSFKEEEFLRKTYKRKFADVSDIIKKARMVKNSDEILKVRQACKISDEIFRKLFLGWNFKTEEEVAAFLIKETRLRGCELAFEPIVASGKNASVPHHSASGKLQKGFCVIDFGVKFKGYCSDTTRTIYLGNPNEKEKNFYKNFLELQMELLSKVKEGVKCKKLHEYSEELLGEKLIHALGHGVGIDLHEDPRISIRGEDCLTEGMVIAIEPGHYVENEMGIRIEDTLLVKKEGYEILTGFTKKLIAISGPGKAPKTF